MRGWDIFIFSCSFLIIIGIWICRNAYRCSEINKRLPHLILSTVFPPVLWFLATRLFLIIALRCPAPVASGMAFLAAIWLLLIFNAAGAVVGVEMHFSAMGSSLLLSYWFGLPTFQFLAIIIRKLREKRR